MKWIYFLSFATQLALAQIGTGNALVPSPSGTYTAALNYTNLTVFGPNTKWQIPISDDCPNCLPPLSNWRVYTADDGRYVTVALDSDGQVRFRTFYREKAPSDWIDLHPTGPQQRNPHEDSLSHQVLPKIKDDCRHLFAVVKDKAILWCPFTKEWVEFNLHTDTQSRPTPNSIDSAIDAFVSESINAFEWEAHSSNWLTDEPSPTFLSVFAYAQILTGIARPKHIPVLTPWLSGEDITFVGRDPSEGIRFRNPKRHAIAEVLRLIRKPGTPYSSFWEINSEEAPPQAEISIHPPPAIHISLAQVELTTPKLDLTQKPYRVLFKTPISVPGCGLEAWKSGVPFTISIGDVPAGRYTLTVTLAEQGPNRAYLIPWVSKPAPVVLKGGGKISLAVSEFIQKSP